MIFDNMGSIEVYLSLGSNLGERRKNIIEAISCLDNEFGTSYSRCSDIIETEPWGEAEGGTFLNCAICYTIPDAGQDIELYCNVILSKCKRIESALGRIGRPEYNIYGKRIYRARTIDIDILFYVLFHYGLSWNTDYSSLCYTIRLCCLPTLYIK